jgi:hypothetical protein
MPSIRNPGRSRRENTVRRAFLALVGVTSLTLAGCGAEKGASTEAPEDVGVSMGELTNCIQTSLVNAGSGFGAPGYYCEFWMRENNFVCDEGVVGQASTETLVGDGITYTVVATSLFGQPHTGENGYGAVTIATQWGHVYASTHYTWCRDTEGTLHPADLPDTLDPWSKGFAR